ncbi:ATP-binding protein [Paenibacillus physcomitrellae]|uniref:histidine kinase n=1 Tax=Paenibacillus physcomitrellae TaxID=1619311 RepID=A0ABQ1GER2_9BACL|nr:ATP-binding protein [Paenibacillus physcomitrellae]GGA42206.1 hypothetical protein GCM10010917_29320 [Paenibacillus physcomitrellae]
MKEKMVQLTRMTQISHRGHVLYIYDEVDHYVDNAVYFVLAGVEHGHHLLIVENKERYKSIQQKLQERLTSKQLERVYHFDYDQFYRVCEDSKEETSIHNFGKEGPPFFDVQTPIRIWTHVECSWNDPDIILKLQNFEKRVDWAINSPQIISVYAYDGNLISASLQNTLLTQHEYLMTDQELLKSALYKKGEVVLPLRSAKQKNNSVERKLRATEHQLDSFIMRNLDAIMILDNDNKVLKVNEAFEKKFGWCASDILGMDTNQLMFVPEDRKFEVARNRSFALLGDSIEGYETVRKTKQGQETDVMLSCFSLRDENDKVNGRAEILRDMTESKQAQQLMIRSEKLSVAGELAAGIAHEIRNPVTTIKGFLQLIKSGSTEKKMYYEIMSAEIGRIELILSELLVLAKPQATHFERKKIKSIIKDVVTLLSAQANMYNVVMETELMQKEIWIECEENHIKQVFINILKNAFEAMPHGGKVLIQSRIARNHIIIRFIDQGSGIPKHILANLGQPFYTTKEKGTGLGFMISKKLIENHGGCISLFSEEKKGTTVEISLPLMKTFT